MIRLAPRLVAARAELVRGVALLLDAPTPDAWRAARDDGQIRIMAARARRDPADAEDLPMIEALLDHFVVGWEGVEDDAGKPVAFSLAAWRELAALDPRLLHHARIRLAEHITPAVEALAEGNA